MTKIDQQELKRWIAYDPIEGSMWWIRSNSNAAPVGALVKGKTVRGYLRVQINKVRYKAHDLAHLYMTGHWPANIIDHVDGNPSNLKWWNLREATQMQNCANRGINSNNTSGVKGVSWHKKSKKWVVRIGVNGKRLQLGEFSSLECAAKLAAIMRPTLHQEFARDK